MVAKIASTEDQRSQFQQMPPQQHDGDGHRAANGSAAMPPATNGGEIIDEHEHRRGHHRHHRHHNNGEQRGADKVASQTSPLSPSDSHAMIDWLKNNAPAWLLSMLGLAPVDPAKSTKSADSLTNKAASATPVPAAASKSADAAEILAGDASLWQNKNYLAANDLNDIVAHPSQHPATTVTAAQTMLDNPTEFSKADGANTAGTLDGQVWKQDLIAYAKSVRADESQAAAAGAMPTDEQALARFMQLALDSVTARRQQQDAQQAQQETEPPESETEASKAMKDLEDDDNLWAGKKALKPQDLQNVLSDPNAHPPKTVAASLFMLQHPDAFQAAAAASAATVAKAAATTAANTAATTAIATDTAAGSRAVAGGAFTGNAIAAATKPATLPAANAAVTAPIIPTASIESLSAADAASAMIDLPSPTAAGSAGQSAADKAMQVLQDDQKLWGNKTKLTAQDLQDALATPDQYSPETINACLFMLQHRDMLNNDAGAAGGTLSAAGTASTNADMAGMMGTGADLASADPSGMMQAAVDAANAATDTLAAAPPDAPLDTTGLADNGPEAAQAMQTLLDDAALWQGKNGITAKDLQNVVDNPGQHPADTVAAATFLLQHPATFTLADGGASGGAIDGQIWKQDLVAAIDQTKAAAGTPAADPSAADQAAILATIMAELNATTGMDALSGSTFGADPAADPTADLAAV